MGLRSGDSIVQFATLHPRTSNNHGAADVDIFSSNGANLHRIDTSFFCISSKAGPDAANSFGQEIKIRSEAKYP